MQMSPTLIIVAFLPGPGQGLDILQNWVRPSDSECGPQVTNGQPTCQMMPAGPEVHVRNLLRMGHLMKNRIPGITYIGKCPYNNLEFYKIGCVICLPQSASDLNNFVCNVTKFSRYHYSVANREGKICNIYVASVRMVQVLLCG